MPVLSDDVVFFVLSIGNNAPDLLSWLLSSCGLVYDLSRIYVQTSTGCNVQGLNHGDRLQSYCQLFHRLTKSKHLDRVLPRPVLISNLQSSLGGFE